MKKWIRPRNKLTLSGLVLCSIGGCLLSKWVDFQIILVISVCLFSLLFMNTEIIENWLFNDWVSSPILSMSVLVTALSILGVYAMDFNSKKIFLLISSLTIVEIFFLSKNLILMFISFELSLVPMLALILFWGPSPERIMAGKYMTLYTMVASAPLLLMILLMEDSGMGVYNISPPSVRGGMVTLFCLLAFLVKVPLFLTHSWLPRAHVEAPLEGSMVLAGVMLKVGVYGFIRMMFLLPWMQSGSVILAVYSVALLGSVYSMCSALSCDDLKMSVAFSSVSHMNLCVAGVCSQMEEGVKGGILSMVSHGLVSPLLFFNVTLLYFSSHSRSVLMNKGFHGKLPQLKLLSLLIWTMNLGVPPFLSFLGEVKVLSSIMSFSQSVVIILMFMMLSSVYMCTNYGILNHSGLKTSFKGVSSLIPFLLGSSVVSLVMSISFFLWVW